MYLNLKTSFILIISFISFEYNDVWDYHHVTCFLTLQTRTRSPQTNPTQTDPSTSMKAWCWTVVVLETFLLDPLFQRICLQQTANCSELLSPFLEFKIDEGPMLFWTGQEKVYAAYCNLKKKMFTEIYNYFPILSDDSVLTPWQLILIAFGERTLLL